MNECFSRLLNDERADVPTLRKLVDNIHKCMDEHFDIVNALKAGVDNFFEGLGLLPGAPCQAQATWLPVNRGGAGRP